MSSAATQQSTRSAAEGSDGAAGNESAAPKAGEKGEMREEAAGDGVIASNWDKIAETFDDMDLREELLRGIYAYGFEKPSAIQQRAIKPMLMGRDVIAKAQSGTGKTATFSIGILQQVDNGLAECQALVLAPTRELAQQIVKVMIALGDFMSVRIHACVGGTAVRDDIRTLQNGVHVVVGTPGRVYDMINRRLFVLLTQKYLLLTKLMRCF